MKITVVIATHGDSRWEELAWSRAYPSTVGQGAHQVLVMHMPEGTLALARTAAATQATGDWLCFLDADDELEDGYLSAMQDEAQGWSLLAPAVRYVWPNGSMGEAEIPSKGRWPDLNECVIGTLLERDMFLTVGGFRELPSLEDYDLWLRCAKVGARIVHVPEAVYRAYRHAGSRNSDQSVYYDLRREHAEVWNPKWR